MCICSSVGDAASCVASLTTTNRSIDYRESAKQQQQHDVLMMMMMMSH